MFPQFEIGEIAILQNLKGLAEYNGTDVEVIGKLEDRLVYSFVSKTDKTLKCYHVSVPGFREIAVLPYQLKKKRPPTLEYQKETVIPWNQCIFQPVRRKKEYA